MFFGDGFVANLLKGLNFGITGEKSGQVPATDIVQLALDGALEESRVKEKNIKMPLSTFRDVLQFQLLPSRQVHLIRYNCHSAVVRGGSARSAVVGRPAAWTPRTEKTSDRWGDGMGRRNVEMR
jgi:hypothetical protein